MNSLRTARFTRLPRPTFAAARSPLLAPAARPLSHTARGLARKDAQDKDSLKPEPNEYSKSGSDDDAARASDAAFSADKTRPEEQHAAAGGASGDNPLEVSPANQEVSKPRGDQEGGHEGSARESGQGPSDRERTSGGGSPDKGQKGQKYSS